MLKPSHVADVLPTAQAAAAGAGLPAGFPTTHAQAVAAIARSQLATVQQHQCSLRNRRNDAAAAAVATQHSQYLRADTRRRGATFQPSSNTTRTSRTNITTAADAVALGSIGSMGPYGTTTVPHSGQNPVMEAIAAVTSSSLSAAEALVALPVGLEQSGPGGRRSAPRPPAGAHDGDGGGSGVMAAAAPIAPTAAPVGGQGPPPRQLVPVPAASGGGGGVVMVPAGVDPALAEAVLRDAVTWDTGAVDSGQTACHHK